MKANISHMEFTCLALVCASLKLRHYFLDHSVRLLARMDPLPLIETCVSGRVARWQMLLSEFYITYVTQKARKEQAIADHLAHLPLPSNEPVKTFFPDSEIFYADIDSRLDKFDGALNEEGNGIGLVLLSPDSFRSDNTQSFSVGFSYHKLCYRV